MTRTVSLAELEKTILSRNGGQISFTVKKKYCRPLLNWGYKRFPSHPFPKVGITYINDKEHGRVVFFHGTIQEQINDVPLPYEDVKFSWLELARFLF